MKNREYLKDEIDKLIDSGPSFIIQDGVIYGVPEDKREDFKEQIEVYLKAPADLINGIIGSRKDVSYLEIGVDEGETFDLINASFKHGVDPYGGSPNITHKTTSQMFFALNEYFYKNTYDIIFIDGCHLAKIIEQEVKEALKILNPGGVIILHDTAPVKEIAQMVIKEEYESLIESFNKEDPDYLSFREYSQDNPWLGYNGDSWRVVYALRQAPESENLMISSAVDACCTIVALEADTPKLPPPPRAKELNWDYYYDNCANILVPVKFEEAIKIYNSRLNYYKDKRD